VSTLGAERNSPTLAPWRVTEELTLARGHTSASTKGVVSSSPAGLPSIAMLAAMIPDSSSLRPARGADHAGSLLMLLAARATKMTRITRARKSARMESSTKAPTNKHLFA
jgi:hypothetical protein